MSTPKPGAASTKTRGRTYTLATLSLGELNRILQDIGARLDSVGFIGQDGDVKGRRLFNLALGEEAGDAVRRDQIFLLESLASVILGTSGRLSVTDNGDGTITLNIIDSGIDHGSTAGLGDDDHTHYHTDARAASWLSANHETTYAHADIATNKANIATNVAAIALNTTHRNTTTGNPHSVAASDLVTGSPKTATYTFGGGASGDVASMTFENGILTAVTLVP